MSKKIAHLFPTYLYREKLRDTKKLNTDLETAIVELMETDREGLRWSADTYPNGYTSYASRDKLHIDHPVFRRLMSQVMAHVHIFIKHLNWDIKTRHVKTLNCWANAMGQGSYHGLHNHQQSMLSGVYYINAPKGSAPFELEDPRVDHFMATPQRRDNAPLRDQLRVAISPKAGELILFESWMRHEVPMHAAEQPRLSVAFNFGIPLSR